MFNNTEFEQIDWHLCQIENNDQVDLNVNAIRRILKTLDDK